MRRAFDILKIEEGCFVVADKLVATGGLRAVTSHGKRYIKTKNDDEKKGIKYLFNFCKKIGACCRLIAEDDGNIIKNISGKRSVNRKNNSRRAVALAELHTTIREASASQVSTGASRSGDILKEKIYRRQGFIAVSLGIKDPDKKHLDVSREAFSKFPLGHLAIMECLNLSRAKRTKKMRQLMKKYPQVNV